MKECVSEQIFKNTHTLTHSDSDVTLFQCQMRYNRSSLSCRRANQFRLEMSAWIKSPCIGDEILMYCENCYFSLTCSSNSAEWLPITHPLRPTQRVDLSLQAQNSTDVKPTATTVCFHHNKEHITLNVCKMSFRVSICSKKYFPFYISGGEKHSGPTHIWDLSF